MIGFLRKTPNNVKMWYEKGLMLSGLGKEADAFSAYEKVLSIDPGHARRSCSKGNDHRNAQAICRKF